MTVVDLVASDSFPKRAFLRAEAQSVLITFAITVGVVLALMLFACQTKYDFTGWKMLELLDPVNG